MNTTGINKNVANKQKKWRIVFMIMIVVCLSWMSFSRSRMTMTMVITSIKENYDDNGIALEERPTILVTTTTTTTTASTNATTRTIVASQRQQQQEQEYVETATADFPSGVVRKGEEEENSTSEVAKQQGGQKNPQREEVESERSSTTTAQEQPSLSNNKQEENEKAGKASTTFVNAPDSISPVDTVDEEEGQPLLQSHLSGTTNTSIQEEESSSFADSLSMNTSNSTIAVKTDEVKEPFYKIKTQDQNDEVASSPVDVLDMTPVVAVAAAERKRNVSGTNTTNTTIKVENVERLNSSIVQVIDSNRTSTAAAAQNTTSVVDSVTASEGSGKIVLKTLPPPITSTTTTKSKTTTIIIEEQEPAAAPSSTNTTNNNNNNITAENVVTSDNNDQIYHQPLLKKNPKPNKKANKNNLLVQWMKNGTSVTSSGNNVKVKSLLQPATSQTKEKQKAPPAVTPVTPYRARNSTMNVIKDIKNGNETFSACLLIMDDNHLLVEWLAYHYTVLPLRRLIVAVDPRSNRSPLPILQRWKGKIDYTLWNDEDYIPDVVGTLQKEGCRGDHNNKVRLSKKNETVADATGEAGFWTTVHRTRQPIFMNQCMTQLKKENRTWTLLIDTDEFLAVNNYAIETIKQSLSWIPSQSSIDHNNSSINLHQDNRSATTTILQRIKEIQGYELARDLGESLHWMYQSGCLGVPRLPFGVRESTIKEIYNHVPSTANSSSISPISFNASNFVTHRWRHTYNQQSNGKPVIDLSRVDWKHLKKNPQKNIGVHPGIISYCGTKNRMIQIKNSYFIAHHYPGTFEQWSVRKTDARAWKKGDLTYETYLEKYDHPTKYKHADDTARGWLNDFVNDIGMDDAQKLLKGVGEVHGEHQDVLYNYSNTLAYDMCQRWHHATGSFVKDQKEMEQKVLEQKQKQMEKWKQKKQKNQQV